MMDKTRRSQLLKTVRSFGSVRGYLTMLVFLAFLEMACYFVVRQNLLQNAHQQGMTVARSYGAETQNTFTSLNTLLSFGAQTIDLHLDNDWNDEQLEGWLLSYFNTVQAVMGESSVAPCAYIRGRVLTQSGWLSDADITPAQTSWFQQVDPEGRETVYTGVYTDPLLDTPVVTVAQMCKNSDATVAVRLFPDQFAFHSDSDLLPEDASFYICDGAGVPVSVQTTLNESPEEIAQYVQELSGRIRNGEFEAYNSWMPDVYGGQRKIYYHILPNNWMTIITVPYDTILADLNQVMVLFSILLLLFLVTFFWVTIRDIRMDSQMRRTQETIQVLGNSFYALYRVNFIKATYEMIKGSPDVRREIPEHGDYALLTGAFERIIEANAYADFIETFALDNIAKLVSHRIYDFGGDFQRLFGAEYRWVNVRVLFDETLQNGEVVLCFREINGEKQQQLQEKQLLETALENSRKSEQAKHAFFNNMSHDMRTPLNAIVGLTGLMEQHLAEPEVLKGYVDKIRYSSRQLLDLVNDILEMSRIEQGKIALNNQQFSLKTCVEECADSFAAQAQSENKDLQVHFQIRQTMVMGDPLRMGQILNNLLSNAFKFTNPGASITVTVRQMNEEDRSQYLIQIEDTGIGMSQEFLSRIFEPYAREVRFSSRPINGTGLGMAIVKNLVTQMSGEIQVKSQLGKGTVFTIIVPFLLAEEAEEAPAAPQEDEAEETFSLEGRRILLAEDNPINMEIAEEVLSMHGITVVQAWNGQEALETFQHSRLYEFDAILMDMQMPVMDGCEASRQIRALARPDAASIPIIAVTANAFTEDIAATTKAGMNAHVAKPIDFSVLCRTLEDLIAKNGQPG